MSQQIADGVYWIDKSDDDYIGAARLSLNFAQGIKIATMRQENVAENDTKWELKYDTVQSAYTIRNVANGLYLSYEREPATNVQLYSLKEPKYYQFRPSETVPGRFNLFVKDTDIEVSGSPLMSYPPLVALQEADSVFTGGEKVDWKLIPA